LPRWLMLASVTLCGLLLAGSLGLMGYGLCFAPRDQLVVWLGAGAGTAIGAGGGLFGTLCDHYRKLPVQVLWQCLRQDRPMPFFRVFWPATAMAAVGAVVLLADGHRALWQGLLQTGSMLALMSGGMEAIRRHTHRQAQVVFALYADGTLDPVDATAIDDLRRRDARFDTAVRAWQELGLQLRNLVDSDCTRRS
jgi:hypothetical protein